MPRKPDAHVQLLQYRAEESTRQIRALRDEIRADLKDLHAFHEEVKHFRSELRTALRATTKAMQFMLELIQDPEAEHHAKAVVRDYFNTRPEKKKL